MAKKLSTQPRVGPVFDLRRSDHLLGLMGVERAGARDPALGQDLHRKQLGIDFRFEGAGGAYHAGCVFVRFVRTKCDVPNIALRHAVPALMVEENFAPPGTGVPRKDYGSSRRSIIVKVSCGVGTAPYNPGGFKCTYPMKAFSLFCLSASSPAGWPARSCAAPVLASSATSWSASPVRWWPPSCFQNSAFTSAVASSRRSSTPRSAPSSCC